MERPYTLSEQLQRARAEVANTAQRAERQIQRARGEGFEQGIHLALEIMDELERAADAARVTPRVLNSVREGFDVAVVAAEHNLAARGIIRFRPNPGDPFDARTMHAIAGAASPGSGTEGIRIAATYASGYRYANGAPLRPAKVSVH